VALVRFSVRDPLRFASEVQRTRLQLSLETSPLAQLSSDAVNGP